MPKWKDYKRFLDRNGGVCLRKTDHYYYDFHGRRTKCSFGDGEIPYIVWRKIKKQLGITDAEFNSGLK